LVRHGHAMNGLVTYRDFANLAKRMNWTPESLAGKFRGIIENPSEFFHRALSGKPAWDTVIPYRSVIKFIYEQMNPLVEEGAIRSCVCGCKRPTRGRKIYATGYCRVKTSRIRSRTVKRGSEKPNEHKAFSVII